MVAKIAFLFPGQGSQSVGMGKPCLGKSQNATRIFLEADRFLGFSLSKIMFEGPEDKLRETDIAQPALFVASAAALEFINEQGLKPVWVAGHSLGEYSALYAAGVISFENALKLVFERGKAMKEAAWKNDGTMAAIIGLRPEKINECCKVAAGSRGVCVPANFNSESQIVISGTTEEVKKAMESSLAAGATKAVQLNVAGAFHSPLMKSAAEKMRTIINQTQFNNARYAVVTNVDARPTTSAEEFKNKLIEQIDHAVLWDESMRELLRQGAEAFIEVGSGRVLSTMIKKLDRTKTVACTDDMEGFEKLFPVLSAN